MPAMRGCMTFALSSNPHDVIEGFVIIAATSDAFVRMAVSAAAMAAQAVEKAMAMAVL